MNAKRLFVVFSLIGWSIALAAIYQWSQPAANPFMKSDTQPHVQSLTDELPQAEQPTQYLLPHDNYYRAEQPRAYTTPLYQRQQPQIVEM